MTLGEIAKMIEGEVCGDPGIVITGIREIEDAAPQHLVFAMDPKHVRAAFGSRAGAVVVKRGLEVGGFEGGLTASEAGAGPSGTSARPSEAGVKPPGAGAKACILVEEPRLALAAVLEVLGLKPYMPPGVDPTARIAEGARVSPDARVGAHAVVEPGAVIGPSCVLFSGVYVGFEAEIGEGTVLYPNVVIGERVKVGSRVIIHAGAVVGADGFGFVRNGDIHRKIPQVGTVVIEDDVEIGANTCIDRATLGQTVIGRGTKIDNLVQVGHNVRVGRNCIIVGQTGIGGSAIIDDGTVLAGQAGIVDHVTVGPGSTVAAGSLVATNVRPGEMVSGRPARPHIDELRAEIAKRKLPDLMRSLLDLQETVRSLEKIVKEINAR